MATQGQSKNRAGRTAKGKVLTALIEELLDINAELLSIGPLLTRDPDISSIRWQMLFRLEAEAKTAAQLGREIGISRQGALWNLQALEAREYIEWIDNPNDLRAQLAAMTPTGRRKLDVTVGHQIHWSNALAEPFNKQELETTLRVMRHMNLHTRTLTIELLTDVQT
ncbi:hypothetical protein BKP43_38340 [Variovorax boronicumulans]|uniref:MarR family winged helix-turn-helix transcriptional regulator n=1 Tax=Variovorax boronicumulans TaxID=436515 RepID=UPI000BB37038|nr:MarR family winged helix-turn-helix transcriptional regulator [Variovorax boronicumulans]PBI87768.1 hypothetical protein BKP43_38340 [Variovorax boronicumulans]